MQWQRKLTRGFTMVEMLVVIVVIAILAVITVVAYNGVQYRANESAAAAAVENANKQLELYRITNRFYPGALSDASIQNTKNTSYQYTVGGTYLTYCLTATTNNVSMFGSSTTPAPARGGCPGHSVDGVAPITNYALNPSLETGLLNNGWAYASATGYVGSVTTTKAYNGTHAAMVSVSTTTVSDSYLLAAVSVPSAGTYYVSAYVYLTSSANGMTGGTCSSGNKDAAWYNGSSFTYVCYNRSNLNGWQRVSTTLTASGATTFQLRFYPPVASGTTMYVDALMVSNGSSNYADGNTSGWAWSGTANASTSSGMAQ